MSARDTSKVTANPVTVAVDVVTPAGGERRGQLLGVLTSCAVVLGASAALAQAPSWNPELRYVQSDCTISPKELATWFDSGKISKDGAVHFADSLGFPQQNTKCDFYKWAHQMFLWITSPSDGGIVLDSPSFFDVNFDANGGYYVSNGPGAARNTFALRGAKPQSIQPGGQAGGNDTLLSLGGSLVYFGVHANDVYAWFNTAVTNGVLPTTAPFPTTQAELTAITTYAAKNGTQLADARALTLELKTAWVDVATVANPASYITIPAWVPNYVKLNTQQWVIDSKQPAVFKTLALVGFHIVGPVAGHPEMVWATFEHLGNAPDNTFYFDGSGGSPIEVPYNSSGSWNFMRSGGSQTGALVAQMTVDSKTGNINATTGNSIRANDVYRVNPWGNAPTAASAENNSELISLNIDIGLVLALLGDVRANYFQLGAVWTRNGTIPSSGTDPNLVGSLLLSNATMETYHQFSPPGCFGCHSATTSTGTSHLFSPSNRPLVPKVP
jgi:hypothetical protein